MKENNYDDKKIIDNICSVIDDHQFIFDNLDDAVWSISWPDLKVQFISKAIEYIIGYSVEEFQKDPLLLQKITHPDDKKINNKALKNLKEKGYAEREIRIIAKNGNIKWVHDKGKMVYDEKNNPIKVEGVMRDVTQRKKAEKKLEFNKNRYQTIFNSAPIGFMLEDEKGNILEVNEVMCEDSGYSKEELEGSNVLDKFVLPEHQKLAKENIKKILQGEELEFDIKTPTKDGQIKYYHLKETNITLPDGSKGIISMHLDITERKEKEKEIKYLAYRDSLTDLYNRKFFEAEIERLDTERQLPISIIMGDLNGLKIINDSYGQKKGDELLIKTAELLKEVLREEDVLARYGGDEFTILLPQTSNKIAKKIVERIKIKSREQNKDEISISISLGAATKKKKNQKMTETIKKAEDEMYQNKLSESRSSKSNVVQGLLNTLNTKSSETKEHAVRMTKLAFDFGENLGLPNYELNKLSLLATLHDIGKTTIPGNILKKPSKLENNEWELIKKHSEQGYKIASASEEFAAIADEILFHHEKWNGSGYPERLEKEEIPYLARIITIIDSYDVMTNDRPYSKAISKKKALIEINDCAGSQFDPELAEKFIEFIRN